MSLIISEVIPYPASAAVGLSFVIGISVVSSINICGICCKVNPSWHQKPSLLTLDPSLLTSDIITLCSWYYSSVPYISLSDFFIWSFKGSS